MSSAEHGEVKEQKKEVINKKNCNGEGGGLKLTMILYKLWFDGSVEKDGERKSHQREKDRRQMRHRGLAYITSIASGY